MLIDVVRGGSLVGRLNGFGLLTRVLLIGGTDRCHAIRHIVRQPSAEIQTIHGRFAGSLRDDGMNAGCVQRKSGMYGTKALK